MLFLGFVSIKLNFMILYSVEKLMLVYTLKVYSNHSEKVLRKDLILASATIGYTQANT